MKGDSVDKVVMAYFAAVTAEPFTYKGTRYQVSKLTVSPGLLRGYTCPAGCGGCCPKFTLDYLPTEELPYRHHIKRRTVPFDGRGVPILTDAQEDWAGDRCHNLRREDGRCGIHGRQPFSCDFELIRVVHRPADNAAHMTQRLFARGWNMKRTDGGRGAKCTIYPADPATVADVHRRLARLAEWADHFGLATRLPLIRSWIETVADAPEEHPDLVLPARVEVPA